MPFAGLLAATVKKKMEINKSKLSCSSPPSSQSLLLLSLSVIYRRVCVQGMLVARLCLLQLLAEHLLFVHGLLRQENKKREQRIKKKGREGGLGRKIIRSDHVKLHMLAHHCFA
jgi:hypothetical protein